MRPIIDVDAHFEPGSEWVNDFPDLAKKLPVIDSGQAVVEGAFGDFVRSIPESRRPPMSDLVPPGLLELFGKEKTDEKDRKREFEAPNMMARADAPARLKWMDAQGIDIQNIICLSGLNYLNATSDVGLRQDITTAVNDWLAETCGHDGDQRLLPITNLEFSDLRWAAEEIGRMRQRGSRIVLIPGAPVNDKSPAHPDWDELWEAITDNGMIAMFHVGFGRVAFESGWSNMGGGVDTLRRFGMNFHHFEPQLLLSALAFGGVFERHPNLTLVTAEVGVGWLPSFLNQVDDRVTERAQKYVGKWEYPLKPSEYLKRNVRGTPLSWGIDQPLEAIMAQLPEDMIVFSSDFPHFEGFQDPKGHYRSFLDTIGERRRDLFLGDSILAAYEKLGDPLVLPRSRVSTDA